MAAKSTRDIILASKSPRRKKILKLLGIKFQVKPSKIKEVSKIRTTCSELVVRNALLKAHDVAKNFNDAIIIGADTLVYLGGKKIIGKPRSVADAKGTLKILCKRPQWIYTGLAIIDTKNKKIVTGVEKTKIYMLPMTDKEIDRYYKETVTLDKAGGFDIQGRGGLFMRRVVGCYYNVIGLPLAKLCKLLKKAGVNVLMLLVICNFLGCTTEYNLATKKQEVFFYNTEKEIKLGDSVSRKIEQEFEIDTNPILNARISKIGRRIADVCDRKELVYIFKIIDDEDEVNAISLPGGYVYIFKGIVDNAESDDEIASVIAHEVAHITARHSIKKLQASYGYTLLMVLATQSGNSQVAQGVDLAFASAFSKYSQEDEFLADKLGMKYLKAAGYDPKAAVSFLKKLRDIQAKKRNRQYSYWKTHPYITQRISALNQELTGKLEFRDYINLMEE